MSQDRRSLARSRVRAWSIGVASGAPVVNLLCVLLLLAAAFVELPARLAAQGLVVVSRDSFPCRGCTLVAESLAVLGASDANIGAVGMKYIARRAAGDFVVTSRGPMQRYDSTGRYLGRLADVGLERDARADNWPRIVRAIGDTLVAFTGYNAVTVLTPELQPARTLHLPVRSGSPDALSDGRIAIWALPVNGRFAPGDTAFWLFGPDGQRQRSFGPIAPFPGFIRSPGRDGTIWIATSPGDYDLQQWSPERGLLRRVVRDAPFLTGKSAIFTTFKMPPPPRVVALAEDGEGLVWVATQVASPRWREAAAGLLETDTLYAADVRFDRIYDTVVEVLDPATGELIAWTLVPAWLPYMPAAGYLAGNFQMEDGAWAVKLYALRLRRPPP